MELAEIRQKTASQILGMFPGVRYFGRDAVDDLLDRRIDRLHGDQQEEQHLRREPDGRRDIHNGVGNHQSGTDTRPPRRAPAR